MSLGPRGPREVHVRVRRIVVHGDAAGPAGCGALHQRLPGRIIGRLSGAAPAGPGRNPDLADRIADAVSAQVSQRLGPGSR